MTLFTTVAFQQDTTLSFLQSVESVKNIVKPSAKIPQALP